MHLALRPNVRSDILRLKRENLTYKNFERFVMIKENEKCFD